MPDEIKDYSIAINTCRQMRARLQETLTKVSEDVYKMIKGLDDEELRISKLRETEKPPIRDDEPVDSSVIRSTDNSLSDIGEVVRQKEEKE